MNSSFEGAINALKLDHSLPLLPGERLYQDFINLITLERETLNKLDCKLIGVLPGDYRSLSYIRSEVFTKSLYAILMFRRQNGHHDSLKLLYSRLTSFYLKGINRSEASSHTPLVNFIYDTALSEGVNLSGLSIENFVLYVEVITIKFLTYILEQIEALLPPKES
ncbi:MAG: hypothetical protein JNK26_00030 [Candidatus Doudnabacteria bacterium]|nr:hypothetical protein [Candidatus Doudnabacteria bacterium]